MLFSYILSAMTILEEGVIVCWREALGQLGVNSRARRETSMVLISVAVFIVLTLLTLKHTISGS